MLNTICRAQSLLILSSWQNSQQRKTHWGMKLVGEKSMLLSLEETNVRNLYHFFYSWFVRNCGVKRCGQEDYYFVFGEFAWKNVYLKKLNHSNLSRKHFELYFQERSQNLLKRLRGVSFFCDFFIFFCLFRSTETYSDRVFNTKPEARLNFQLTLFLLFALLRIGSSFDNETFCGFACKTYG